YPVPSSHESLDWLRLHGAEAGLASCGVCHTRESCATCHVGPPPEPVARLAPLRAGGAPGAAVARRQPESHAAPLFATAHGQLALARPGSCAACHERARFCGACHEGGAASAGGSGAMLARDGDPVTPRRAGAP